MSAVDERFEDQRRRDRAGLELLAQPATVGEFVRNARILLARVDFNTQTIPEVHQLHRDADAWLEGAQQELRHIGHLLEMGEYATARREGVE